MITKFLNFKTILNYITIFIVFSDAIILKNTLLFELRLSYFILFLALSVLLHSIKKLYFSKTFLIFAFIIICSSLINVWLNNNSAILLLKQITGIGINALVFYLLIKINNEDVKKLFRIYLNLAFLVAIIGIVQEAAYLLRIEKLFDFRYIFPKMFLPAKFYTTTFYRVNSIMPEPSSFCVAMMPAFFAAVTTFFNNKLGIRKNKIKFSVIILSFLLSFSTTGYLGIVFMLILLVANHQKIRNIIIFFAAVIVFIFIIYSSVGDFRDRVNSFTRLSAVSDVFAGKTSVDGLDQSTFTFLNNLSVTTKVFMNSPLFGFGIGSYPISFHKYGITRIEGWMSILNFKDANSLFMRILSEGGLFALGLFLAYMVFFYVRKKDDHTGYLWIISTGILVLFLIRLVRQGHYFSEGLYFFFWVYYFIKKTSLTARHNDEHTH